MSTPVRSDLREGGVLLLTLDRPPANAIDEAMLEALESACSAAARDPGVRAVVLTGAGAFFCGGFDLVRSAATRREHAVSATCTARRTCACWNCPSRPSPWSAAMRPRAAWSWSSPATIGSEPSATGGSA